MNSVELVGRLVKDPAIRYTSDQKAVASFVIAVDRDGQKDENGKKITDFPKVNVFGRQAEAVEKYAKKGKLLDVQGRLQTGSYTNKKGDTVYTTEVFARSVEILEWDRPQQTQQPAPQPQPDPQPQQTQQDAFEALDEDVPF